MLDFVEGKNWVSNNQIDQLKNIFYTKKTAAFQENLYLRKNMENLRKQKRHLQQQVWPPKRRQIGETECFSITPCE